MMDMDEITKFYLINGNIVGSYEFLNQPMASISDLELHMLNVVVDTIEDDIEDCRFGDLILTKEGLYRLIENDTTFYYKKVEKIIALYEE